MKLKKQLIGVTSLMLAVGMLLSPMESDARGRGQGNGAGGGQQAGLSTMVANLPMQDVSAVEEIGLNKMREEEKLARDVYHVLYKKWNHRVFDQIAKSEQQHMDAVKALFIKYSMVDPARNSIVGVFTDPELQKLYNSLVAKGERSLLDAFQVGATIEDLDIKDLYDLLEQTDNTDIQIVYQNLAKGSRNHLRAFSYQLSLQNANYEAQFLTAAQVSNIITSPAEFGRVDENGVQVSGNQNSGRKQGRRMSGNQW